MFMRIAYKKICPCCGKKMYIVNEKPKGNPYRITWRCKSLSCRESKEKYYYEKIRPKTRFEEYRENKIQMAFDYGYGLSYLKIATLAGLHSNSIKRLIKKIISRMDQKELAILYSKLITKFEYLNVKKIESFEDLEEIREEFKKLHQNNELEFHRQNKLQIAIDYGKGISVKDIAIEYGIYKWDLKRIVKNIIEKLDDQDRELLYNNLAEIPQNLRFKKIDNFEKLESIRKQLIQYNS